MTAVGTSSWPNLSGMSSKVISYRQATYPVLRLIKECYRKPERLGGAGARIILRRLEGSKTTVCWSFEKILPLAMSSIRA